MIRGILATALAVAIVAPSAHAADFNFMMTFDGTDITLDGGSDVPAGTALVPGDTFTVMLSAAGTDFWRVTEELVDAPVPLSFQISDSGTRYADIMTTWSLDGGQVATRMEPNTEQAFVHVGAQLWSLDLGLEFDKVQIDWVMNSTDAPTSIADLPDFFGFTTALFFRDGPTNGEIEYVEGGMTPIPVPAAGLLYLPVLAAGAFAARRLRRG